MPKPLTNCLQAVATNTERLKSVIAVVDNCFYRLLFSPETLPPSDFHPLVIIFPDSEADVRLTARVVCGTVPRCSGWCHICPTAPSRVITPAICRVLICTRPSTCQLLTCGGPSRIQCAVRATALARANAKSNESRPYFKHARLVRRNHARALYAALVRTGMHAPAPFVVTSRPRSSLSSPFDWKVVSICFDFSQLEDVVL